MLLLTSISDKIQLVTGQAITVDVHVSWVDNASGTITPGRTNTAISTATTTDIVAAPAFGAQRNIQTLLIRNTHASSTVDITVQHTDGTTTAKVYKTTLSAGNTLEYLDGVGFNIATLEIPTVGIISGTVAAGDDWRLEPQQTIQVSKDASTITGKWYSSVKAACDYAATVATTSNRILVYVYPGEYTESPFTIPSFTYLHGSDDWGGVNIITNDNANHFITYAANSGAQRFAITGPTGAGMACLRQNSGGTAKACWINIRSGSYGLYASSGRVMTIGVVNDAGTAPDRLFCVDGTGMLALLTSHAMTGTWAGKFGVHCSGSGRIVMDACVFRTSGGTSVYVQDSGYIRGNAVTFVAGVTGMQQEGSASFVDLNGTAFTQGGFTTDILCNGVGSSSFSFSGYATHSKISVTGSITPILNFADAAAGDPGQHIFGELYVGPDIATGATALTSFIDAVGQTGKFSGGAVSRNAGLNVDVASGSAMFDDGNVMSRVDWNPATIALPSDTDEIWVTVDDTGTVSSTISEPDPVTTVVLAQASTDATDVMFLASAVVDLGNLPERVKELQDYGIGGFLEEGGTVIINGGNGLSFDANSGTTRIALTPTDYTTTNAASFTYWRRDGVGGWIQTSGQTTVNATQYDDGTGTLATMTASFYRGDLLFIAHPNGGKEFHVVIGQNQYASPSEVKISPFAVLPDVLMEYSARLALLIVQKSAASMTEIQDKRILGAPFQSLYPPHNILSAGTQAANISGLVNFANSNGVSFGMSGNSQITASHNALTIQSAQSLGLYAISNTTGQSTSSTFDARTLSFVGAGGASVGYSGGSVVISVPPGGGAGDGYNIIAAGSQTANTTGTIMFSNSNGVTFGMSNSSVITASVAGVAAGSISAGATRASLGEVVLSNSNGVSFGVNGQTVTASHNALTSQSNQAVSFTSGSVAFQTLSFTNSNGFSFNSGTQGVFGSYTVPTVTNSSLTVSDAATSGTLARLAFTNLNGVTLLLSTGAGGSHTIVGSHNALTSQSNQAASAANGSFAFQTLSFSNLNGISFGTSAGSAITASHNALTSQSNQAASASNGSFTFQTVAFSNANNVTFGTSAGSIITASVAPPGAAAENNWFNLIGNTAGDTTASGSTIALSGGNNITLSGTNGSVIVISAGAGGGGGVTYPRYAPFDEAVQVAGQQGQGTLHIHPVLLPNVQHDQIALRIHFSNASSVTGSATISHWVGIYTRNGSTISLSQSTSISVGITYSGTVGNNSLQAGPKLLTIPWTTTWPADEYFIGLVSRTTTAAANASFSQFMVSQINSNFSGIFGVASNASNQRRLGQGVYSASTSGIPNSIAFSDIRGTASLAHRPPCWIMLSQTV